MDWTCPECHMPNIIEFPKGKDNWIKACDLCGLKVVVYV